MARGSRPPNQYDRAIAERVAMQLKSRATDDNDDNDDEERSGAMASPSPVKDDVAAKSDGGVSPTLISISPLAATTPDEELFETKLVHDARMRNARLAAESETSERDAEVVARFARGVRWG